MGNTLFSAFTILLAYYQSFLVILATLFCEQTRQLLLLFARDHTLLHFWPDQGRWLLLHAVFFKLNRTTRITILNCHNCTFSNCHFCTIFNCPWQLPHTHLGYVHNEGDTRPKTTKKEDALVEKAKRLWETYKRGK